MSQFTRRTSDAAALCLPATLALRAATTPDVTVATWLRPEAEARVDSYAELDEQARRWAGLLESQGVARGDVVAIMSANRPEFLAAFFGASYLGAVVAPLHSELRGQSLAHPLTLCSPRVVVVEPVFESLVLDALDQVDLDCRVVLLDTEVAGVPGRGPAELALEDPALVMFTSGTTGPSKGTLWTHGTLRHWAQSTVESLGYTAVDRIYCCTPLIHANALVSGVMAAVLAGASAVLAQRFSVSGFWRDVALSGSTSTNILGSMIGLLLEAPRAGVEQLSLRTLLVSSCSAGDYVRIREEWGVVPVCAYGLTDFGILTIGAYDRDSPPGSCGRAADGFAIELVDSGDRPVDVGEVGELVVRPTVPGVAPLGYVAMAEQTVASRRNLWFHTGDLLRRDAQGNYYFAGRSKDALRFRGENVSTYEVENAILRTEQVLEVAVYALPSPLGEDEIAAAVVATEDHRLDLATVVELIAAQLPHFAIPRYFRVLEELPKNASQRVVKSVLVAQGVLEDTWDRESVGVRVARNRDRQPGPSTTHLELS